jgi:hypothetical protein
MLFVPYQFNLDVHTVGLLSSHIDVAKDPPERQSVCPSGVLFSVLNFSSLFFIESSWTSSPPRPPSPSQSQTSFDTLSRKQNLKALHESQKREFNKFE